MYLCMRCRLQQQQQQQRAQFEIAKQSGWGWCVRVDKEEETARSLSSATFHTAYSKAGSKSSQVVLRVSRLVQCIAGSGLQAQIVLLHKCQPVHGTRSPGGVLGLVCREWYRLPCTYELLWYERFETPQSFIVVTGDVLQISCCRFVLALSREGSLRARTDKRCGGIF